MLAVVSGIVKGKLISEGAPGCAAINASVQALATSPRVDDIRIGWINHKRQDSAAVIRTHIDNAPTPSVINALPYSTVAYRTCRVNYVRANGINRQHIVNSIVPDAVLGDAPACAAIGALVDSLIGITWVVNVRACDVSDIWIRRINRHRKYINGATLILQSVVDRVPTSATIGALIDTAIAGCIESRRSRGRYRYYSHIYIWQTTSPAFATISALEHSVSSSSIDYGRIASVNCQ